MQEHEAMNDAVLMQASAGGDALAFGALARRHGSYLLALLRRFGLDAAEAEDTAQQALLNAFRAAARYDVSRSSPRSWLSTIALNLARNQARGRQRFRLASEGLAAEPMPETLDPAEAMDGEQRQQRLQQAILGLPHEQRSVLLLRIDAELPFSEIGRQLGITAEAAKQRFHRASSALKKEIAS